MIGPQPSTLPDLRRRPVWSSYTGLQDAVVTEAARSSDPTTTAAWQSRTGSDWGLIRGRAICDMERAHLVKGKLHA